MNRYEEYFFSPRRLLLYNGQAVFKCRAAEWREDLHQEQRQDPFPDYALKIPRSWEMHRLFTKHVNARRYFARYVQEFTARNLDDQLEIVNAFAGFIDYAKNDIGLDSHFGLTKPYFALDFFWVPWKWAQRRDGFPSWSWTGWKGPILTAQSSQDYDRFLTDSVWLKKSVWVSIYLFSERDKHFHIIQAAQDSPRDVHVHRRDNSVATVGSFVTGHTTHLSIPDRATAKFGDAMNKRILPLLERLSYPTRKDIPKRRPSPLPLSLTPNISEQTILIRALTAYVFLSAVDEDGKVMGPPRNPGEELPYLPSAPSVCLYTSNKVRLGTAWVYDIKLWEKILMDTVPRKLSPRPIPVRPALATKLTGSEKEPKKPEIQSNLKSIFGSKRKVTIDESPQKSSRRLPPNHVAEVVILTGPTEGEWRSRIPKPSTWEYVKELASAGVSSKDILLKFGRDIEKETKRCTIASYAQPGSSSHGPKPPEPRSDGREKRFWKCIITSPVVEYQGDEIPVSGSTFGPQSGITGVGIKERSGMRSSLRTRWPTWRAWPSEMFCSPNRRPGF